MKNIEEGIQDARNRNLFHAVTEGNIQNIRKSINEGANVNISLESHGGLTPLLEASLSGELIIVEYLLDHGADLNSVDSYGDNALIMAASEGHMDICQKLISYGINYDHINNLGLSAIDKAREKGHHECMNNIIDEIKKQKERFHEMENNTNQLRTRGKTVAQSRNISNDTKLSSPLKKKPRNRANTTLNNNNNNIKKKKKRARSVSSEKKNNNNELNNKKKEDCIIS